VLVLRRRFVDFFPVQQTEDDDHEGDGRSGNSRVFLSSSVSSCRARAGERERLESEFHPWRPKRGCSFVGLLKWMNGKKRRCDAARRRARSTEVDVTRPSKIMNFPYSSLIVEADSAKQKLTRLFQTDAGGQISSLSQTDIKRSFGKGDPKEAANRLKVSFNLIRDSQLNPSKNTRSSKGLYWMREDMGALSFAWTLVLMSAVTAIQTDQPVLWLLIGPAPLAIGITAVGFLRRRFDLCAVLREFRSSYQCQYRCQCKKGII
jgi:hypothetical protein